MRPVQRALAIAAVVLAAGLSVAAAGCGGDDTSDAEQWADDVCTELNTWADSVTTTITGVLSQGLGITRDDLSSAANQASAATTRLVDGLKEIGPPDTDSGEQAQQALEQAGDQVEQHADKARSLVEGASSSGSGLADVARSVLVEIGAAADAVKSALGSIGEAGDDIKSGIEDSDACQKLSDRDFASG
jgi:hypothetical protein